MNAHELQAYRRLLFLSSAEAARYLAADAERPRGVDERTWNRWEAGARPVPDNIARTVLDMVAWRAHQVRAVAAQVEAGSPSPCVLPWIDDPDDWPDGSRAHWRAHQSACATVLAAAEPGAVVLGAAPTGHHPPGA